MLKTTTHEISIKGRKQTVPAYQLDDILIVTSGKFVRVAEIFDAYWLVKDGLPDPRNVVERLKEVDARPDLFTFTQRAPQVEPLFDYHLEWDNVAAVPISSYEDWLNKQISSASKRNIRTSEKKGVTVRESAFDEKYIRGIMSISDESPLRAGRRYWHYGKDFATVEAEQGTYRDRSTFLAAYLEGEMVGYLKLVWDTHTAAIMQIVSKMSARDRRPNNALLSAAVRCCAERGVNYLLYERYVYGNKEESSLTRFKRENGFLRMNLPCYYVPLTAKGRMVLGMGLHKSIKDRLPEKLTSRLIEMRNKWNAHTLRQASEC